MQISELFESIHLMPEISGHESHTINILCNFLESETDLDIHNKNGWLYGIHHEGKNLPTIAIRADMDAIYRSNGEPFHGCGHDGHSSMAAGAASLISGRNVGKNVIFLFQPAEETGAGAEICFPLFDEHHVDMIMGLHNIPGFKKGQLLFSKDTFADASEGLTIRLTGQQSHAGYPGQGANPAFAAAEIIQKIPDILKMNYNGFVLITVVSINVGEKNFGISAGEAEICLTLRSEKSEDLLTLEKNVLKCAENACIKHPGYSILEYKRIRGTFVKHGIGTKSHPATDLISVDFSRHDVFPVTENIPEDSFRFKNSMEDKGFNCRWLAEPMRWSEDFGHYRDCTRSFFFGLGSGEECPGLHTENYVFPEDLLELGARTWVEMIDSAVI